VGVRKLPPVDETKLLESYALRDRARKYRRWALDAEAKAARLRREHYREQYDRCRACDGGTVGEGLGVQVCPHCNSGLLPKGTLSN
jgi:hypothetical protein